MIALNENCAGFNYVGSSIIECKIRNELAMLEANALYHLQLDYEFGGQYKDPKQELRFGRLLLRIRCEITTETAEKVGSEFDFTIEGEFSAKESMSDHDFNQLLLVNGLSALYGIARSKAEVISTMVYHSGKISLPMINVIELVQLKQSQTENAQQED